MSFSLRAHSTSACFFFAASKFKAFLKVRVKYLTLIVSMKARTMPMLTITAKGQVTLRKDVLKHLGVQPGDKIAVDKLPDGRIEVKAARPTGDISETFDLLKKKNGRHLSIEDMAEISAQGWAGKR